jgi:hypothetical protein
VETLDSAHDADLTLPLSLSSLFPPLDTPTSSALRAMWVWTPFMIMLFVDVAGALHVLPRDVTLTWTWSTYLSTGFITRTT